MLIRRTFNQSLLGVLVTKVKCFISELEGEVDGSVLMIYYDQPRENVAFLLPFGRADQTLNPDVFVFAKSRGSYHAYINVTGCNVQNCERAYIPDDRFWLDFDDRVIEFFRARHFSFSMMLKLRHIKP